MTALHHAVDHGHLATVRALIHAGAALDILANDYDFRWAFCGAGRRGAESVRGRRGPVPPAGAAVARSYTPLHLAADNGHADAMAALLGAGADASIQDSIGYAVPRRAARADRHRPPCRRCPAGGRQSNAHKRMGRAARTRRRWRRRAAFRALVHHIFATASHAATCTVARALVHPRVHLPSAMRPIGRCCRHIRARVLLCRFGTHSEGGPTLFVVTRT